MMFDDDFWGDANSLEFEVMPGRFASKARLKGLDRKIAVMETGRNVCFGGKGGGGGGGGAPAPDPQIGQAAIMNARLGEDWLNFAREQFQVGNIRQEELDALTSDVVRQQLDSARKADSRSNQQWSDYNVIYRPFERMNAIDALGGQYLSDDQVRELLGRQNEAERNRLNSQYEANIAAIRAMGAGGSTTTTGATISRQAAESLADSIVKAAYSGATKESSSGKSGPFNVFGSVFTKILGRDATKNDDQQKLRDELVSNLMGLGGATTTRIPLTEEERQRLIDAETARFQGELRNMTDVTDQVMMSREADRKAQTNAAAEARADVFKGADTQNQIQQRQMASMGLNPNSGRFQGIQRGTDLNTALASAGAQNSARNMVRQQGIAMRADQANYGRGNPSIAAQQVGLGLNAGNSAMGNQGAANANFYANQGIMGQGFGGAMQGYSNQANILNNLYGNQVQAWSAQQQANATSSAGLGQALGTGIGAYAAL